MNVSKVSIATLLNDPTNARKHDEKNLSAIKGSLAKFGLQKPIVVDKHNVVIAGNGTLLAAKELGWTEIAVVKTELSGPEAIAFALADNRTSELAAWDDDVLGSQLQSLFEDGFEIADIGFDPGDFDISLPKNLDESKEDEVPQVEENIHGVKLGDVWDLGRHRLMCGDSTVKENVEKLMDGQKADMVFTDPPYGMNVVKPDGNNNGLGDALDGVVGVAPRGKYKKVQGDNSTETAKKSFDICSEISIQIWWGANFYASHLPDNCSWICWDKENGEGFFADGELAWTNQAKQLRIYKHLWKGMIRASEMGEKRVHPTQKPIALAEWCFENYGKPNSILDLFLGSGSTLIACEKTGRKCYGMELDPHYCSVIIERWQQYTGKKAVLQSN